MAVEKGYVDAPVNPAIDLKAEILRIKKEKGAVIMAHYYQPAEIQDIADYIGDSLALAQIAAKLDNARMIVLCGVHFMGETAKVLCPDKKVLIPDINAGCSLADSCPADKFAEFVAAHPDHTVISYVNTSIGVKALTDVLVTSGNARKIVDTFPADAKLIFGPDRNLGNYINSVMGRNMLLWDGACHVHERPLQLMADVIGSTAVLLKYAVESDDTEFIVATESGILHQMQKSCPDKTFIPAPPNDSTCGCNDCRYMKLNTMEKLYNCLKFEQPEIIVDPELAEKARRPIERMLELS